MTAFNQITLHGKDSAKFLQGQLTVNTDKLTTTPTPCAIANLKGRVLFGLWATKIDDDTFTLIISDDCTTALQAHLKKYGAFSKFTQSEPTPMYPAVINGVPAFSDDVANFDESNWQKLSISTGNYWLTAQTQELFQPQELRLHQRGGVDYDKGCYLGQEIIARLYFKANPKAYLHRVRLSDTTTAPQAGDKIGKAQIVNINGNEALIIGSPDDVAQIGEILPLPDGMNGDVARQVAR